MTPVPTPPLPLSAAASLGLRALTRQAWLTGVGLLVALARRGLGWPALLVGGLLVLRGAVGGARLAPLSPGAPLAGAALVLGSPRVVALLLGLWLAGVLLGLALRLAWLAGALPTLAAALGPAPDPSPRFADGVAHLLPRLLPVALLALLMELGGAGFAAVLALAAVRLAPAGAVAGQAWLAAPVALALTLALVVPLALSVVADAALVRAAVRAEGPLAALAGAVERFVRRPAVFLLGGLLFAAASLAGGLALGSFGSAATGFAPGAAPLVLLGPQLMLGALGLVVAAATELWWLASLTALATHAEGTAAG